jgi:hypothetical protein
VIERNIISGYRVAQSLGFKGDFRPGSTCCGFTNKNGVQNVRMRVKPGVTDLFSRKQ